jgi:hypothetical protein
MEEDQQRVAVIDDEGALTPVGDRAVLSLQARRGMFHVLPAPPQLLFLRRANASADEDGRRCVLSGEIRGPGALCDILSFVGHASYVGEFLVLEETSSRSIYFDRGHVVGARSLVPSERLGQVLQRYGVLTPEQVHECAKVAAQGSTRFGEAAVRFGFVTRENLFASMSRQTEEIFYGTTLVGSGMFYFLESFDDSELWARQQLAVSVLIRESVRRMHETRYFRARIPSDSHIPVRVPGRASPQQDPLGAFAAVDDQRTVAELCRVLKQGEFEVSRALFQLIQSGHVAIRPPRLTPTAMVEVYNQAIVVILRELDAMDEGDPIREQLEAFAESQDACRLFFAGAGPADDGTLAPAKVLESVRAIGGADAEERLATALYEYASYALFLARPHLRRAHDARLAGRAPGRPRISQRIAAMLDPLAPKAQVGAPGSPAEPVSAPRPSGSTRGRST